MLPPDLMLATPCTLPRDTAAATLTASGEWTVEVKLDGVRGCVTIDGGKVRITNRTGRDITIRYPEIVQALSGLGIRAVLDGEIVVMVNGKPNFHAVQIRDAQSNPKAALALSRKTPARFIAFDVLVVNGIDVTGPRGLTYEARHDRLEALARDSELDINPVFDDGGAVWAFVLAEQAEGVVLKRRTSKYLPGYRPDWVKVKRISRISALVTGFERGRGHRRDTFGALELALIGPDGHLIPVGSVGTGFANADLTLIRKMLDDGKEVIVDVEYMEAPRGRLRQPSFKGVRLDIDRSACRYAQLEGGN
jgi:bifunctional non-homologous end joining protein LigD